MGREVLLLFTKGPGLSTGLVTFFMFGGRVVFLLLLVGLVTLLLFGAFVVFLLPDGLGVLVALGVGVLLAGLTGVTAEAVGALVVLLCWAAGRFFTPFLAANRERAMVLTAANVSFPVGIICLAGRRKP